MLLPLAPKVLNPAPEVEDGEPQPKKLCAPPPSSDSNPGSKGSLRYRCLLCTGVCYHYDPETCVLHPLEDFFQSDDEIEIEYEEYQGEREGYTWSCMLGCSSIRYDCLFDHGPSKTNPKYGLTRGFYVLKYCLNCNCNQVGHWTYECPTNPPEFIDECEADILAREAADKKSADLEMKKNKESIT